MKALLIKDWKLLAGQKQFFGIVSIIALGFLITNYNPAFVISYVTIMFTIFTISTLQYDDYENGMSYLLTLPVDRKEYVIEKYLFGIMSSVIISVIMLAASWAAVQMRGLEADWESMLVAMISAIVIAIGILVFTVPIQLKFGAEKSRIAWMAGIMIAFVIAFVGVRLLKMSGDSLGEIFGKLEELSPGTLIGGALGGVLVLTVVSILISIKILEKKEF